MSDKSAVYKCITLKHATPINAFLFLKSPMKPFFSLLLLENQLLNNANKNMCGAYISEKKLLSNTPQLIRGCIGSTRCL
jgi:hypothetical protein